MNDQTPSAADELPINKDAQLVDGVVHVGINVSSSLLKTYLHTQIPLLNTPIISQIFDWFFDKYADVFYKAISMIATFTVIRTQVAHQLGGVQDSKEELKTVIEKGDKDAIELARQKFEANIAKLGHFDGGFIAH